MVKTRRTAVSPKERRKWLEDYENGGGITEISTRSGRDIRIVKKNIDVAREEILLAQARVEFLRGRLESHHQDLLGQVERLKKEFMSAQQAPVKIGRLGSTEHRRLLALIEHVKQQKLGQLLNSYETKFGLYRQDRETAFEGVSAKGKEITDQILPGVSVHPWSEELLRRLEHDTWSGIVSEYEFRVEESRSEDGIILVVVYYGGLTLARTPQAKSMVEPIQRACLDLFSNARSEWIPLGEQVLELKKLKEAIIYEFDTLLLKHMVSGQCDLCP